MEQQTPIPLPRGLFYGWVIVWVSWLANLVTSAMNPVVFSIFIVPMRDGLGVGMGAMAWVITVRLLASGFTAPIMGRLVDRFGARWIGAGGGLLGGVSLIALYFVDNIWLIYLIFGISGITGLGVFGAANIVTTVPPANWFVIKRGRAVSIASTGIGLGTAMGVPIAQLMVHTIGWRAAWVVFGLVIIAVVVPTYALLIRRRPEDVGLHPDGVASVPTPAPAMGAAPGRSQQPQEMDWTSGQAVRTFAFWLLLISFTVYMFSTSGVLFLRVPFWDGLGVSPTAVAFGMATDPFVVMVTMLLFGIMAERRPIRVFPIIGGIWRGISMIPLLIAGAHPAWVFVHNITWGIGSGGMATAQNLAIPNYFGRPAQGTIRGLMAPPMIAGGALAAPVVGYMVDAGIDINIIWWVTLVLMTLSGLVFIVLKPPQLASRAGQEHQKGRAQTTEGSEETPPR